LSDQPHPILATDLMEPQISKRLHISGLTPTLSAADISQRLSSFGTVKALDGFGLLDGVNRPRTFGYVTIEGTASNLAKCKQGDIYIVPPS